MWKCRDCGETFDEPRTYTDYMGEFWGSPSFMEFAECPYCGSSDYDEEDIVNAELEAEEDEDDDE